MPKKPTAQLSLAIDTVDAVVPPPPEAREAGKTRTAGPSARRKVKTTPPPQPFLPGLSRRGRPRSPNPVSPSVRALESRKRRVAAGGRRIEFLLEPEAAAQLDALVEHFKISRAEVIARLIARAAKRLK